MARRPGTGPLMTSTSLLLGLGLPGAADRVARALVAHGVRQLTVDPSGRRIAGVTRWRRWRARGQHVVAHIDEQPFSTVRVTVYSWPCDAAPTPGAASRTIVEALVDAIRRSLLVIGTSYRPSDWAGEAGAGGWR